MNTKKILFIGNMNNIMYSVSKLFKSRNFNVTQLLDAPLSYILDRPEAIDNNIEVSSNSWIKEFDVKNHGAKRIFYLLFPKIFYRNFISYVNNFDAVFVSGDWLRLVPYLSQKIIVHGVFVGIDLEIADFSNIETIADKYSKRYKFIPKFIFKGLAKRYILLQREGIKRVNTVNYYLPEIMPVGEKILNEIKPQNSYKRLMLRGLETELFPYHKPDSSKKEFVILNITRFCYTEDRPDNKRNDIMIQGIASFIKNNKIKDGVKVLFFNKGTDVEAAKEMVNNLNLTPYVTWLNIVPMGELVNYFKICNVAFDQLGNQWLGSGLYSMLVGRPLIANNRQDLYEKYVGKAPPICQASTADEVADWLTKLYLNPAIAEKIGKESSDYVRNYYDIKNTVDFYLANS